jgi:hypothetical protein
MLSTTTCTHAHPVALPPVPAAKSSPAPRVKVLVVVHPDGYLQAFAEKRVDVRFVNLLDVHPDDEVPAEQALEAGLPAAYRDLHWPCRLRATGLVERITAQQALDTTYQLSILHGLRKLEEEAA